MGQTRFARQESCEAGTTIPKLLKILPAQAFTPLTGSTYFSEHITFCLDFIAKKSLIIKTVNE
jgi:hypothetical protein